jgi:O-antigen/teichoic acid export membrane protein
MSKSVPNAPATLPPAGDLQGANEDPARSFERQLIHVAQAGGASFAGKLFITCLRLISAVILARVLGSAEYGQYSLALTIATFTAALAILGLDSGLVRFISAAVTRRDAERLHAVLSFGFFLPMAVSGFVAFCLFAAAEPLALFVFGDSQLVALLRVSSLLVPLLVWNSQSEAALRGFKRLGLSVVITSFFQSSVRFGLLLVLVLLWASAMGALVVFLIAAAAAAVCFWIVLRKQLVRAKVSGVLARELVSFSLPVYASDLLDVLAASVPTFLLGAWGTLSSVGVFAIASQFTMLGQFFHGSLVTAAMPIVTELNERGARDELGRLYRAISKWSFTLNLPLFLIIVLFPTQLLALFGVSFTDGSTALVILAFGTLLNTGTGISGVMLVMTGHSRLKLYNALITTCIVLGASVLLIPSFGLVGAALASLGATATLNLLRLWQTYRLFGLIPYDAQFLKPLCAAGVAVFLTVSLQQWFPLTDAISLVVYISLVLGTYLGILFAMGISGEDRMVLSRLAVGLRANRVTH